MTSVTVALRGSAHVPSINNGARFAGPTGAENDRTVYQYRPQDQFGAGLDRLVLPPSRRPRAIAFSAEAQQQCTGDAFRLCSSEIPNIPKITACMIKHRSDLSTGCRSRDGSRSRGPEVRQARRAVSSWSFGSGSACVDATQALFRFRRSQGRRFGAVPLPRMSGRHCSAGDAIERPDCGSRIRRHSK